MNYFQKSYSCIECNYEIDTRVYNYSMDHYNAALCRDCQEWIKAMKGITTELTIKLYLELRKRDVPAELEKDDGHKSIDIAVVPAKVNIEVDGQHHNFQSKQALADLRRTYHSFVKGYLTLRIPNSLVINHLEETADLITDILNINTKNNFRRKVRGVRF